MEVLHLNQEEFDAELAKGGVLLADFWATWCGPCRMIAPIIEDLAKEYDGRVKVCKIDTDENGALCMRYGIQSIPNVIIFKNGRLEKQLIGAMPKPSYTDALDEVLG